ncbi:MAG: hypothetical protein Q4F71_13025 [Paracoccus sp. (in: a-proteobacteria)]|nr:hypothetical protein [Paracoccus sp. (in: a-proteobacteria)]
MFRFAFAGCAVMIALPGFAFELGSEIPDIRSAAPAELSAVSASGENACRAPGDLATIGGQIAHDLGWQVLSELVVDGLAVVSFAGQTAPSTSGTCVVTDGNLGIFRGSTLLGLFYTDPTLTAQDGEPLAQIGALEPAGPGRVRVLIGDQLALPLGDLVVNAHEGATLEPVAASTEVCGARAVPDIYGQPILEARDLLGAAGWAPVPVPEDERDPGEFFAANGITEVSHCAGSGMGYCGFNYRNDSGDTLFVVTGGDRAEYAPVLRYEASCGS